MISLPTKLITTVPDEDRRRSLFGEILDWILAPLLLLWPLSIAVTYLVAKSIANHPFDRALEDKILVLSQQIKSNRGVLTLQISPSEQRILLADAQDTIYFQLRDERNTVIGGDLNFPELPANLRASNAEINTPSSTENANKAQTKSDIKNEYKSEATSESNNDPKPANNSAISPAPTLAQQTQFRYASINDIEVRIAARTVIIENKNTDIEANTSNAAFKKNQTQIVLIQVGETLEKRSQLANEIIKGVIFPQFLILPIGLTLIWLALTRGLKPLLELQKRLRARGSDDLSPIVSGQIPEEISPLIDSFNEMLARLSQSIAIQKRFIADAAHQMKTPLAGMRTQSELALRQSDPQEIQRSLFQIAKSSETATHLVNQLLSLARAENLTAPQLSPLDLAELARQIASDWVPAALNARIDLGLEVPHEPCLILANSVMLRELINNLMDNALHYTPVNKRVTLRVRLIEGESEQAVLDATEHNHTPYQSKTDENNTPNLSDSQNDKSTDKPHENANDKQNNNQVYLEVEDQGIGINPAEIPRIFERFYRILNNQGQGSGLGLAIVREIAQQHNADINVLPVNPGTLFRVRFAAATSDNNNDELRGQHDAG